MKLSEIKTNRNIKKFDDLGNIKKDIIKKTKHTHIGIQLIKEIDLCETKDELLDILINKYKCTEDFFYKNSKSSVNIMSYEWLCNNFNSLLLKKYI